MRYHYLEDVFQFTVQCHNLDYVIQVRMWCHNLEDVFFQFTVWYHNLEYAVIQFTMQCHDTENVFRVVMWCHKTEDVLQAMMCSRNQNMLCYKVRCFVITQKTFWIEKLVFVFFIGQSLQRGLYHQIVQTNHMRPINATNLTGHRSDDLARPAGLQREKENNVSR